MSDPAPTRMEPLRLVRPELLELLGYEPIEPVDVLAEELGIPPEQIVKLDGNENPYGPSPRVKEALVNFDLYHIYPDPDQRRVREALADYLDLDGEHIVAGNGSDELLDLIACLFLAPGDGAINCVPTFGMYAFVCQTRGARVLEVPRREDFSLDLAAVREAAGERAKVIFIASPNNPSGNSISMAELKTLLSTGLLVVVDEAYVEFSEGSFVGLVPQQENLIVLRTFSKWAGLAGLRAGYGVFPKGIAELMRKVKMPYNMNVAAQAAVLASLEDRETLQQRVEAIVRERERLFKELATVLFLRPFPSRANFILCRIQGVEAKEVWRRLRQQGIFVRYFDTPGVKDCIRITVGKPEHTDRLLAALREIGGSLGR
ncbi:MAG: histidinol-phosphate transaminase [Dehalococcoidia bacterium]